MTPLSEYSKPLPPPTSDPVLMVVRALPGHRPGGLEYHTLDLVNGLARRGISVTVLTTESEKPWEELRSGLEATVELRFLKGCKNGSYSLKFWRTVRQEVLLWCDERLKEGQGGIVHYQEYAGLLASVLPPGFRTWMTIHGTVTSEVSLDRRYMAHLSWRECGKHLWRHRGRLILGCLFGRMLRASDGIFTDSEFTRQRLLHRHPKLAPRIIVAQCGLDWSRFGPAREAAAVPYSFDRENPLRIVLLQRMQDQKGIWQALRAVRLLLNDGLAIQLIFGGSGEHLEALRNWIRSHNYGDRIQAVGRIPEEGVSDFLASGHVILIPDLTQPAFGLIAVEAMHHGLAVVAARSGALPELISPTCGWIYDDPWNEAQLAGVLRQLVENPSLLSSVRPGLHAQAAQFSQERMTERILQAYFRGLTPEILSPETSLSAAK